MPRYIVPARLELSFDPSFSLLARNSGAFTANGTSYPRMITLEDGARHPLFNGGVVSAAEIEQIAAGTARAIVDEEHGADILIVQVLEGAKPFCQKVLKYLVDKDAERKIEVELASLKVSSYTDGSRATSHRILIPLQDSRGREITSLGKFETVVVIDDLIDAGTTFAWLVKEYLPRFSPKALAGYFMLDKNRKRSKEVEEVLGIRRTGSAITGHTVPGEGVTLIGQEPISTNFWVFSPEIFSLLEVGFRGFLAGQEAGSGAEPEFLIPTEVNRLLAGGEARVWVLRTRDQFFGITHPQDWEWVAGNIRELIQEGRYPENLWGDTPPPI